MENFGTVSGDAVTQVTEVLLSLGFCPDVREETVQKTMVCVMCDVKKIIAGKELQCMCVGG